MAVIAADEVYEGRSGGIDKQGVRHFERRYQVYTDNLSDDVYLVLAYPLLPRLYESYVTSWGGIDRGAICISREAVQRKDNPLVWDVDIKYDSARFRAFTGGQGQNDGPSKDNNNQTPADLRPWIFKFSSQKTTKILAKDANGRDVVNSAGQQFDPPISIPSSNPMITITAFKSLFLFSQQTRFQDCVNNQPWQGFPPHTVLVHDYAAVSQYDNGQAFWQVDVVLLIKWDGWNPIQVLDAGSVEKISKNDNTYRVIVDDLGHPVQSAVPLDGTGRKLKTKPFIYLQFYGYREDNFNQLI